MLPDLKDEILNWLPVNIAARAFAEASLLYGDVRDRPTNTIPSKSSNDAEEMTVHHILNPKMTVRWADLPRWISPRPEFEVVPVDEWLAKFTALQDDDRTKNHLALRFLEFWRKKYGSVPGDGRAHMDNGEEEGEKKVGPHAAEASEGKLDIKWKRCSNRCRS